jgi:hypothetical protein
LSVFVLVFGSYTPKECCVEKHRPKARVVGANRVAVKCRGIFTIILGGVLAAGQNPSKVNRVVAEKETKIKSYITIFSSRRRETPQALRGSVRARRGSKSR